MTDRLAETARQPLTFEGAFERFYAHREAEGASPRTLQGYAFTRLRWREFSKSRGAPKELETLEEVHVLAFVTWLRARKSGDRAITSHTVSFYFRSLSAFLHWCERKRLISPEVMRDVHPPKVERLVPQVILEGEAQALMSACRRPLEHLIVTLLLDTGLRVSELLGLRYADVDLDEEALKVCGKGAKERIVTLSSAGLTQMREYVLMHPAAPEKHLIAGIRGPLTPSGAVQLLRRLARRAGLKKRVTPHILRHSFATFFIENGGDVHSLKDELGHSTLEMARRYVHVGYRSRRELKERVSVVQRLNGAAQGKSQKGSS